MINYADYIFINIRFSRYQEINLKLLRGFSCLEEVLRNWILFFGNFKILRICVREDFSKFQLFSEIWLFDHDNHNPLVSFLHETLNAFVQNCLFRYDIHNFYHKLSELS